MKHTDKARKFLDQAPLTDYIEMYTYICLIKALLYDLETK